MKKRVKYLLLGAAFAGITALSGCGGSANETAETISEGSVEEYVQAAHKMLEEADSFVAEFEAVVSMNGADETTTSGQVVFVKEPLFMNVDTTLVLGDLVQDYDMYLEKAEDEVNQYMSYDGEWTEMTMSEASALAGSQIYHTLYNMETIFSAAENWTMEADGKELELTAVIPEAKFYAVEEYTRWFQMAGMSGLSEVYFAGVGDVPVTVMLDGKTGAPLSYEIDLAQALETVTNNVLTELGGGTLESGVTVTSYKITSELIQLGGVEAEPIPDAAKSSAINYEEEISMMAAE